MKKRILSLFAAIMITCSLAVNVTAATVYIDGTYQDIAFSTYSTCYIDYWHSLIELQSYPENYQDYLFYVKVAPYEDVGDEYGFPWPTVFGASALRIATNYGDPDYPLLCIYADYYINGVHAKSSGRVTAS